MFVIAKVYDEDGRIIGLDAVYQGKTYYIPKKDFLKYSYANIGVSSDLKILGNVKSSRVVKSVKGSKAEGKKIILYHGSPNSVVVPTYGKGKSNHDYGNGFYLTSHKELAKEWSWCLNFTKCGYLHTFELDTSGLRLLNLNKESSLVWMAELMTHRVADKSEVYKQDSNRFIKKYKKDTSEYDVIYGWRADSSYFQIAKRFIRNQLDYDLIRELFTLGDLDNQFCLKSRKAFSQIRRVYKPELVPKEYGRLYYERDELARKRMSELIQSPRNTRTRGIMYCLSDSFKGGE